MIIFSLKHSTHPQGAIDQTQDQCHACTIMKALNQLQPFSQLGTHSFFDVGFDFFYKETLVVKLVRITCLIRNVVQYMVTMYNAKK